MNSPESLAFLSGGSQQAMAESGLAIEYRSATPAPITYAQFVDALLTGDGASAIDEVRDLQGTQPTNILLNDFYLFRLAYSLLYSWGLSDEAMQLSKLNVELNPSSTLAAQGLSRSYVDRGDYAAAIELYRRLLEKNPDENNVRRTLEWLQNQQELSRNRN
jgi:tetratricopeptide (TPR) repeat protein